MCALKLLVPAPRVNTEQFVPYNTPCPWRAHKNTRARVRTCANKSTRAGVRACAHAQTNTALPTHIHPNPLQRLTPNTSSDNPVYTIIIIIIIIRQFRPPTQYCSDIPKCTQCQPQTFARFESWAKSSVVSLGARLVVGSCTDALLLGELISIAQSRSNMRSAFLLA